MRVGMMWYDDDRKQELGDKMGRAANHYQSKYGRVPNLCFANPKTLGKNPPKEIRGMELRISGSVLPHHYWLGVNDRLKGS